VSIQELIYGLTTQALILDADRPLTSATATVYRAGDDDTSTALVATTGAVTVDAPTETLTADAGDGEDDPRKLTMASTAGFSAGRRYVITGGGNSELFEIAGTPSATVIYARHPLRNAYATGAVISGSLRASISVLAAWAGDASNVVAPISPNPAYRVRWDVVYADTGEHDILFRAFDLVRYPARHGVTWLTMDDRTHGWRDALPPDHRTTDGAKLIADAWEQVKLDLHGNGIADQALRNPAVLDELVIARTRVATIEAEIDAGADDNGRLEMATKLYDKRIARLIETPLVALDPAGGGAASTSTARALPVLRR
jgi:hypothetical protein